MRIRIVLALILFNSAAAFAKEPSPAPSQCRVCSDQQTACMKNYAGPTCQTEYQMCMKSCRKN